MRYDHTMSNLSEPNPLVQEIRQQIAMSGPIPFVEFMGKALYHPQYGYYSNPALPIGRKGDFFTNVSVSSLFGQLIGQQFEEMWRLMTPCPDGFSIVEQGAHTGEFCCDVMTWMQQFAPAFYQEVRYLFVEPRPQHQKKQRETLASRNINLDKVQWINDLSELADGSLNGVIFSNELLDSFPIHRIQFHDDRWHEQYVTWQRNKFSYINGELSNPDLEAQIALIPRIHIQRYTTEINLNAIKWISQACAKIGRGFIFTIDYGYPETLYYNRSRVEGTLTCYYKHRPRYNALDLVGEQDITSHINFSAMAKAGILNGAVVNGFTDQHHFMVGIAQDDLKGFEQNSPDSLRMTPEDHHKMLRAFKTLMHPELMGTTFKYLIQQKGFTDILALSGMRFTRESVL
ncbi:MAG: SAM-dependent methyltransferase [Verrucomicrobiota bacterium]|nr:SAM-dependent methyltransferase [Verrucomicrobiota bacterium]